MKHSKIELQQETRPVGAQTSLNVTQAAGHKERWREEKGHTHTHTKKN